MTGFKKFTSIFLIVFLQYVTMFAQNYTVNYKPLSSDIFTGSKPVKIGILEDFKTGEKLYEGLVQENTIKSDFEIYPASVLDANREMLGGDLSADNDNFLKLLNDILRIKYLLQWQQLADSSGFRLEVYSTINYNKLYEKDFYFSLNSTPINDVRKFLVENVEPSYEVTLGELRISVIPENAKNKIYLGKKLVKEWSGNLNQKIEAGNYKLISEAYGFKSDTIDVELNGEPLSLNVKLKPDFSLMPAFSSADNLISNITPELQSNQLKIFYDLNGEKGNTYDITITLTDKINNESFNLKRIIGDAENVVPGKSKVIIWHFPDEIGNKPLDNYALKLSADKKGKGIPWYFYAGGGAVVLGGAAALLLKGSDEESPAERTKISPPPGRP